MEAIHVVGAITFMALSVLTTLMPKCRPKTFAYVCLGIGLAVFVLPSIVELGRFDKAREPLLRLFVQSLGLTIMVLPLLVFVRPYVNLVRVKLMKRNPLPDTRATKFAKEWFRFGFGVLVALLLIDQALQLLR